MTNLLKGILLVALLAFFSCKDKDSLIGENFIDSNLEIMSDILTNVTTLTTAYEDTSGVYSGAALALVGDYHDEIFGDHKAMAVFDFAPESNVADFGEAPQADSLVLWLNHKNLFYGYDTINPITIKAYRITEPIEGINKTALANIDLSTYYTPANIIGQTTFRPGHFSKTQQDTSIHIKLNDALAQEFVEMRDSIISDSAFISVFNGIILKAERQSGTQGSIVMFNYKTTKSRLTLHFHNEENDKQTFMYYIDESVETSQYNFFEHDYTTGSINDFATGQDPITFDSGDSLVFLQTMRGLNMKIKINMADSDIFNTNDDIIINKALLSLTPIHRNFEVTSNTKREYNPPGSMTLFELDDEVYKIPDYIDGNNYYAANYNNEKYDIILSRITFEKIQKSQEEYEIWVRASQPSVSANRAVFYGSGAVDPAKRPKVIIYYSKKSN